MGAPVSTAASEPQMRPRPGRGASTTSVRLFVRWNTVLSVDTGAVARPDSGARTTTNCWEIGAAPGPVADAL
jgi:hypothetical protein